MSASGLNVPTPVMERFGHCNPHEEPSVLPVIVAGLTVAIVANAMVICAVLLDENLRKKALTKMILCFFFSSLLVSFSYMVLKLVCLLNESRPLIRKIVLPLHMSSNILYRYSTCVLALLRLVAMMKPVKYKNLISSNKIEYLIIILCIFSIASGLPAYFVDLNESPLENLVRKLPKVIYSTYSFTLPGMTSWVAYIKMFVEAYRGRRMDANQGTDETRHRVSQWKNEITRTLLVLIVVHTFCTMPHLTYHLILPFKDVSSGSAAVHIIQYNQFLIDPLVFVTMVRGYRNATVQLFSCIVKRCPNNTSLQEVRVGQTNVTEVDSVQQVSDEKV